ncbi:MAG TPA: ComF family protein [Cytophagaceae bacterium]|nr:ComF family protein [Cytophagaceae bacterium]
MIADFLSLLFPDNCLSCSQSLNKGEKMLCSRCRYELPKTNFHKEDINDLNKKFWGRVDIRYALAYLKFHKGGMAQKILYQVKYQGKKDAAKMLGQWYGEELSDHGFQEKFDIIIPVPLHKAKLRKRGYNQSDSLAEGLSLGLNIDWSPSVLSRVEEKTSQTNKSRIERWDNVKTIYQVQEPQAVYGKKVLIVDDVMTTGATFEACAVEILAKGAKEVSVATLAYAE